MKVKGLWAGHLVRFRALVLYQTGYNCSQKLGFCDSHRIKQNINFLKRVAEKIICSCLFRIILIRTEAVLPPLTRVQPLVRQCFWAAGLTNWMFLLPADHHLCLFLLQQGRPNLFARQQFFANLSFVHSFSEGLWTLMACLKIFQTLFLKSQ